MLLPQFEQVAGKMQRHRYGDLDHPRRDLEQLSLPTDVRGISIRPSFLEESDVLAEIASREIGPQSASRGAVRRVMTFNRECFYTVLRSRAPGENPMTIGFYAYLLVNAAGLDALLDGRFDGLDPDTQMLCRREDPPSAIYFWAAVAKRAARMAFPMVMEHLKAPRYRHLDIYVRAATLAGAVTLLNLGYVAVHPGSDPMSGSLLVYRRRDPALAA